MHEINLEFKKKMGLVRTWPV